MSDADQKELARLIRKYGLEVLTAVGKTLRPRGPGRPPKLSDCLERMHLADWIDQRAEELAGETLYPFQAAEAELFEMTESIAKARRGGSLDKWRKSIKEQRLQGRRELRELKKRRRRESKKRSQKQTRKAV
jgi:hypothetical protein